MRFYKNNKKRKNFFYIYGLIRNWRIDLHVRSRFYNIKGLFSCIPPARTTQKAFTNFNSHELKNCERIVEMSIVKTIRSL